ncbi:hypothetical protein HKD37_11G030845 [Glycine soja]
MRVSNDCTFDTLKRRMHNTLQLTNDQLVDEIYYRQPFIDAVPPYGIHESQLIRRLFFRQPSHAKYLKNLIEYEITELKNDEDVLKVLAQSNDCKRLCLIEILAIFNKSITEIEENIYPAQHISNYQLLSSQLLHF